MEILITQKIILLSFKHGVHFAIYFYCKTISDFASSYKL